MNAEIKQKWLEALRSGKYQQGKRRLRSSDDEYCCLGVLCNVVDASRWAEIAVADGIGPYIIYGSYAASMPPNEIFDATGLDKDLAERLATMNDQGMTFAEISDYIEEKA